jgi:hypothetical protein
MAGEEKKNQCAHPSCGCLVEKGKKYCSDYCHDAGRTMELSCNCRHPECATQSFVASAQSVPAA